MRIVLALFLIALVLTISSAAVVEGTVYDADTLDVVEKAIVTVNTAPEQVKVTLDGAYSFEIPNGNYAISAKKYDGKKVLLEAAENITIQGNGTYVLDLLLLPPEDFFSTDEGNQSIEEVDYEPAPPKTQQPPIDVPQTAAAIGILLVLAYFLTRKRKNSVPMQQKHTEEKGSAKRQKKTAPNHSDVLVLSPEQKQAVSVLKKSGGFASQKELRKAMPYSEAKVSLIVTELEEMGAVKKFKRGRGNIIKLLK